jgi:hypothetical protein
MILLKRGVDKASTRSFDLKIHYTVFKNTLSKGYLSDRT